MSAPQHYPSPNNDQGTMMLMALALILIAIVIFHSIFYYACCAMLYYLWYLADFASIHKARRIIQDRFATYSR